MHHHVATVLLVVQLCIIVSYYTIETRNKYLENVIYFTLIKSMYYLITDKKKDLKQEHNAAAIC